jgi:hypothetical protein
MGRQDTELNLIFFRGMQFSFAAVPKYLNFATGHNKTLF